jgi:hypothetical protein
MANRYWGGGAGTWSTTDTTHWYSDAGLTTLAGAVPTAADSVFFQQAATYTVTMTGALLCLDITVSAGTVTFATGTTPTLAVSGSMSLVAGTVWSSTGAITFNATTTGKTVTTNAVTISGAITFNGVGGGWSLGSALTTVNTLTTTLSNGTLTLNGFDLTTGIFSSNVATARTIAFGTNFINLVHPTAAQTVLSMATVTLFTWSGTGGFKADASVTRTYTVGTTGGSTTTAPNLSITTGAAIPTITTASWINNLDFTGGTNTPAVATVNITGSLTLATGGTYTNLSINAVGTGTITPNGKSISAFTVNNGAGTTTLAAALGVTTYTQTAGTIDFATFNLTCSSVAVYTAGTLNNIGTIACTTWTVTGTFNFSQGTINAPTGVSVNSGSFTYNVGATLGATGAFSQSLNTTVTFNKAYALSVNGTYTLSGGALILNANLSTGIFYSTGSLVRSIAFNTYTITLTHITASTRVLECTTITNLTITGTGGFVSDVSVNNRDYSYGWNGGGSVANAVNLTIGGGVNPSFTLQQGSWFNLLDLSGSNTASHNSVVNVNAVNLSSSATYNAAGFTFTGTTTFNSLGKFIGSLGINTTGIVTLTSNLSVGTYTQTAGTLDFATFNLTCSTTASYTAGTLNNVGTITCTTWTVTGAFTFGQGTITPSVGFTLTSGSFTYNVGATLSPVPSFTHTAGTVTLNQAYALTATGTYTLTAGTLSLGGNLTTGIFNSNSSSTRAIAFSTFNIILAHTTAATIVLSMASATAFSWTGTGGFTADASITRTYVVGTTGGSATISPNLSLTGSGTSIATIVSGSWFNILNFGTTAFAIPATVVNVNSVTLSTSGTYTSLGITMAGTGTITPNGLAIAAFTVNTAGTATLASALSCTTYTQTAGTIDFATFNLTCSGAASFAAGTLNNIGTISCTTWAETGTFTLTAGTISASTSFTVTSGTFTYSGGTITTPSFVHTAGSVTTTVPWTMTTNSTYTLTAGTLTLGGNLTAGIFSSTVGNTRAIAFSTFNIILAHTTAATTVLNMPVATSFTWTGTGGFAADASITRTYTFGTTGGSTSNATNLSITSGSEIPTITTGSWFNLLNFTGSSTTPSATVINLNSVNLSTGGTYTSLSITMVGTGTITPNGKPIAAFVVNTAGTATLAAALNCTTYTQTAGTINFATFSLTCSAGAAFTAGTLNNIGTISCTTWTHNAAAVFTLTAGTISASTSFTVTSGTFTYSGGTITTPSFVHTAGAVSTTVALTLATPSTYTLTAGTLTLNNTTLSVNSFITTGTGTRSIAFGTGQITLTGNNTTIWDGGGTGITFTGTTKIVSNYSGSTGTRTINVGTGWTEATSFDVKAGAATGISIGTSATDTVTITGNLLNFDLTGITFTYLPGVMTVYSGYTIPATGGTISSSASATTFASTNVTARVITVSRAIDFPLTFAGVGGTFNLGASLTTGSTRSTTLTSGTLALNGFNYSTGQFIASGAATRVIAFGTNTITLTGNNSTIWDSSGTGITTTGTITVVSNYAGSTGTRTINVGTVWTEVTAFDVKAGAATGISIGTSGTDIVTILGNIKVFDLTGMLFTYLPGVMTVYNNYTIPATGGSTSASASVTTFASTNATARVITISRAVDFPITFAGVGGTFNLGTSLTTGVNATTTLTSGTLALNGFNYSTGQFIASGATGRTIAFGTNTITLTGNNATVWDSSGTAITLTGTITVVSNYAGSVGTRTINVGTLWTEATAFDVKAGAATGISVGTSGTDIVTITGNIKVFDLTGMLFTYSPGVMTVYNNYTIPATGGSTSASTNLTTFASTNATPRIITVSRAIDFPLTFAGVGGTFNLGASLTTGATRTTTLTSGTLGLNGFDYSTGLFVASGATARTIAFGTNQITLSGNNTTIWDSSGTVITFTGTTKIVSNYTGAVGTRTINIGTVWTESTAFDFRAGSGNGFSIGTSATDTVTITTGNILNFDLTGLTCTFTPTALTVYGNFTIPATGGTVSASASAVTFASTNATPRIITVSRAIDFPITFAGVGGTFNLGDNFTTGITRTTTLTSGTLGLNGFNYSTGLFSSAGALARTIAFGSNTITSSGTGTVWDTGTITNLTISGVPVVNITNATATATTVNSGALSENTSISFNFSAGTYALTFLGTAGYTAKDVNFTGFAGTLGATAACTIYGSYIISSGMTVTASANTLTFGATSGTKTITASTKTLPPIAINGIGGTFNLGSNLVTSGLLQVLAGTFSTSASNYSITCTQFDSSTTTNSRSISLNGSTITISGTAGITLNSTNLTFNAGTSQITLSNATGTVISAIGNATFYNVSCTGGAATVTITGANTYNNLSFTNGPTASSVVSISATQTINGTLSSVSTSVLTRLQIQSSIAGTQVSISAAAVSLTDVDFKDINAAGAAIPFTGTRLSNLGNNANITFVSKTVYWSLAAGGNWNSVAWATTSGGTPDVNNYPLAQDICIIQNTGLNTSATITINGNWTIGSIDMSGRTTAMTLAIGTTTPFIYGNWTNGTGTALTGTGTVNFVGQGVTQTITPAGITFTPNITVNSVTGTFKLAAALTLAATGIFTLTSGTLLLNGFNLTTGTFSSNNTNTRSITFGTNNVLLATTTAAALNLDMATITGFSYTGTGGFSTNMSVTRTFTVGTTAGGTTTNAPNLYITAGASIPTITTLSWFGILDFTGSTCIPATATVNLNSLNLATGGTYTAITANMVGTGTITGNSKTLAAVTCTNGTTTLSGTLTSTGAFTINGATFTHPSGAVLNAATFTLTTGTVNLNGGTLPTTTAFNHTLGTLNVTASTTLAATATYTFTAGTITLSANLTTGIFSSSNVNTRSIAFGVNNILMQHTTAAQTVLNMAIATGFTYTSSGTFGSGTGCFQSTMSTTRTFVFGTTGGSTTNAPNLYLDSGASVATITTGSWFNELNFGTTAFTIAATSQNLNSLYSVSSTSVLTALTATMVGTGTLRTNTTIGPLTINTTSGTTTIYYDGSNPATVTCTTCALTSGTFNINGQTLTCSSTFTYTGGTLSSIGALNCTTFTLNGPTFNFTSGAITPTTSIVITTGSFTYGGTAALGSVATFTHTAGTVQFNNSYSLDLTSGLGNYTFTAGTLTINDGAILTTPIFTSTSGSTRAINFGLTSVPGLIYLNCDNVTTTRLNMANATGLTITAISVPWVNSRPQNINVYTTDTTNTSGGFVTMNGGSGVPTFVFGTTGGTAANAPNFAYNASGSLFIITTGSWFNEFNTSPRVDFSASQTLAATSINVVSFASAGGSNSYLTWTNVSLTFVGNVGMTGKVYIYDYTYDKFAALTFNTQGSLSIVSAFGQVPCTSLTFTAGTINFTGTTISCSGAAAYTAGTLTIGAITCTTWTVTGAFNFSQGTLTPSTSFVLTSGSFTYSGTATLSASLPTFTHTAGTATFNKNYSLLATGTYTLTAGSLVLADNITLSTGIFSSTGAGTRSITFGTTTAGNISLIHTTAATVVLNMVALGGFTWTGLGGFTANASTTRTFSVGSTSGGTSAISPNLTLTGSDVNVLTFTTGSWFNILNFGTTAFNPGTTTLNLNGYTLSTSGTYTTLTVNSVGTGSFTNNGKTITAFTVNNVSGTATLADALTLSGALTLTSGTLSTTFNISSASFASTGTLTRAITGSGTYTITSAGASAFSNASATGITISGIIISMTAATAKTFAGGGGSFSTLNQGGAGALTISGNNSFADLTATTRPSTITFTAASTQTFTGFTLSGILGSLVTINSTTAATRYNLSKSAGGYVSVNYLSIQDSNAGGGVSWYAGTGSTNVSNNLGWTFTAPPASTQYNGNFFAFFPF